MDETISDSAAVFLGGQVASGLHGSDVRAVLGALPDAVVVHREGLVVLVNSAFERLTGHRADTLVGGPVVRALHPEDLAGLEGGTSLQVLRVLGPNGEIVHLESPSPVTVDLSDGPATMIVVRDGVAQSGLHEKMQAILHYECMGRVVGSVARAISDPLTYVLGNLAVLSASMTEEAHGRLLSPLADARSGAEQARNLLSDLKALTHPDDGELRPISFRSLIERSANVAKGMLPAQGRLEKNLLLVPWVRGAENRLRLLFLKLMLEAASCASKAKEDALLRVTARTEDGGRAVCEIFDDGAPYGAEFLESWQHPSSHDDARGLGLELCRTIAAEHGGAVEIQPRGEAGPRFVITLPALPADPSRAVRTKNPKPLGRVRRGRILVVDDDLIIGALLRRALDGHDVYVMTSPRDAIELCRDLQFDVVLMDLVMPDLDGTALFGALCDLQPSLERNVLFITAGAVTGEAAAFLKRVPNPVFEKPFDFGAVRSCVESFLAN